MDFFLDILTQNHGICHPNLLYKNMRQTGGKIDEHLKNELQLKRENFISKKKRFLANSRKPCKNMTVEGIFFHFE
jgi:hypothetical protein